MDHPHPDEILGVTDLLAKGQARATLAHVVSCPTCRRILLDGFRHRSSSDPLLRKISSFRRDRSDAYRGLQAWLRVELERALRPDNGPWEESRTLLSELRAQPPDLLRALLEDDPRYQSLALAQRALAESRAASPEDSGDSTALARLALEILAILPPAHYGERTLEDLRARAWSCLGEARRLAGDLNGAEAAFQEAARRLAGTLDPGEEARSLALLMALRRDQGRLPEARELLDQATAIYEEIGETERAARLLLEWGGRQLERGAAQEGLEPLERAVALLDPTSETRTALCARLTLAFCLVDLGRTVEIRELLADTAALDPGSPEPQVTLHIRWLEGLLAAECGEPGEAERLLTEVRHEHTEAERRFPAALVTLDLASLDLKLGEGKRLRQRVKELMPLVLTGEIANGGITALSLLRLAVEEERATAEMIRSASRALRRNRRFPRAKHPAAALAAVP